MLYVDYSAGQLTGHALAAAGVSGAIRYAGTPGRTKNTTPAEVASLRAAGIDVHGVYENSTGDFLGGHAAGVANAQALLADAQRCGIPGALFMTADQHIAASDIPHWLDYLRGAATVLGDRLGAYGFVEAIEAAHSIAVPWLWQCGSSPVVTRTPYVNLWQRNAGQTTTTIAGIECDISDVISPIGVGEMELSTPYTDWNGKPQTVQSTYDHIDQRVAQLAAPIVSKVDPTVSLPPGEMLAFVDNNITLLMRAVSALTAKVDALTAAVAKIQPVQVSADPVAVAHELVTELSAKLQP